MFPVLFLPALPTPPTPPPPLRPPPLEFPAPLPLDWTPTSLEESPVLKCCYFCQSPALAMFVINELKPCDFNLDNNDNIVVA